MPSQNKLGINKPLLTSFQTKETAKQSFSYAKGADYGAPGLLRRGGKLAAKALVLVLIALFGAYLPLAGGNSGLNGHSWFIASAQTGPGQIKVSWPLDQASLQGAQTFKAQLENTEAGKYRMYWRVDGDRLNEMLPAAADPQYKESAVDLSGWNWKGSGPYTLSFVALDLQGSKLGETSQALYIGSGTQTGVSAPNLPQPTPPPASSCPPAASNAFTGCYFKDRTLTALGTVRTDTALNFDWGSNSPDPAIPSDNFSARWEGSFGFNAGDYAFTALADDGVRVYLDNQLVIDGWKDQGPTTYTASRSLTAGVHLVRMEYYERGGGAVAKLSWKQNQAAGTVSSPSPAASSNISCAPAPNNAFSGCYYSGKGFDNLLLSRPDNTLNFDWGSNSPSPQVPSDNFSAKWEGNYNFDSGSYEFVTTADDGVKVYLDNQLIINQWVDQPPTTHRSSVNLTAGVHLVRMEYYERGGGAVAKLSWNKVGGQNQAVPVVQNTSETAYVPQTSGSNVLKGAKLYTDPNSNARKQVEAWRSSRPADALMMEKIASQPASVWLGGWNSNVKDDVNRLVSAASSQGAAAVMIAYNIPNRDCGGYSAGGTTPEGYKSWIRALAEGIGGRKAVVILEPDALTLTSCLSAEQLQTRYELLKDAASVFKNLGQTAVYLDAGHAKWVSAGEMAAKLKAAGVERVDGFSLNTSNFVSTQDNTAYGQAISTQIGGKHFIVDTSRNGNGPTPDMQWCNPQGRALGEKPTTNTGNGLIDAYIWGKQPGESDGACNGGPSAGVWWPEYALGLAQKARW